MDFSGPAPDVSVSLLDSFGMDPCLLLVLSICSLVSFSLVNKGPNKGGVSSLPSCLINTFLASLFLIPQHLCFSFRYGGERFLGWWYCLDL